MRAVDSAGVDPAANVAVHLGGHPGLAPYDSLTFTATNWYMPVTITVVANDDAVIKDDVLEGLTAVVTVRLPEPQFEGQTKEVLGTSAATRIVSHVMHRELTKALTSTKRVDKARARAVLEKVVGAARARIAARQSKELQRRKNALETSSLNRLTR